MAEMHQRPIKFRIAISSPHWDEDPGRAKMSEPLTLGQIIDQEQIDFTDGGYLTWDQVDWGEDTVRYLQYTGLDDKHGTPVFEGDIVQHPKIKGVYTVCQGRHTDLAEAGYTSHTALGWYLRSDSGDTMGLLNKDGWGLIGNWSELEVIGNLYQNGDLLNAQD